MFYSSFRISEAAIIVNCPLVFWCFEPFSKFYEVCRKTPLENDFVFALCIEATKMWNIC